MQKFGPYFVICEYIFNLMNKKICTGWTFFISWIIILYYMNKKMYSMNILLPHKHFFNLVNKKVGWIFFNSWTIILSCMNNYFILPKQLCELQSTCNYHISINCEANLMGKQATEILKHPRTSKTAKFIWLVKMLSFFHHRGMWRQHSWLQRRKEVCSANYFLLNLFKGVKLSNLTWARQIKTQFRKCISKINNK
jgi:hypothetical protein